MLWYSLNKPALADDPDSLYQRRRTASKISRVARNFCKSTEDLCRSANLFKVWDTRQMIKTWRHASWALLRDNNVMCAVWLDDVLAFHGADCSLQDYYLLVHNPTKAARILSQYGYRMLTWTDEQTLMSRLHCQRIRMSAPGAKANVVLLSASEWCYDLSTDALHDDLCPYLPEFIGSMIDLWLQIPTRSHVANADLMNFLANTIHRCYTLDDFGDEVCDNDYAMWLSSRHREVHYDIVARAKGLVKSNLDFRARHKHHVHKSKLIQQGAFIPKPRRRKAYQPKLASLVETPEDTRSMARLSGKSFLISATSITFLPERGEIGVAL